MVTATTFYGRNGRNEFKLSAAIWGPKTSSKKTQKDETTHARLGMGIARWLYKQTDMTGTSP